MVLSFYLGFHIDFIQLMNHLKDAINLLLEQIWLLSSLQAKPIDITLNLNNLINFKLIHNCFCGILEIANFVYISQYHLNCNLFMLVNINHNIELITFHTLIYINYMYFDFYSSKINDILFIICMHYCILLYSY